MYGGAGVPGVGDIVVSPPKRGEMGCACKPGFGEGAPSVKFRLSPEAVVSLRAAWAAEDR
jgi:hypothetical protein